MSEEPRYYPVEGEPSLVRDMQSGAILNTNVEAFNAYKKRRSHEQKVRDMVNEFETVKTDLSEIKNLLKLILTNQTT